MKFIEACASQIKEPNQLKKIELAGKTCYKSESNITDTSASEFVKRLVEHGHLAMLEHGTFCFELSDVGDDRFELFRYITYLGINKFLNISLVSDNRAIVSGNFRTLIERGINDPITRAVSKKYPDLISCDVFTSPPRYSSIQAIEYEPSYKVDGEFITNKHTYFTARVICDRGVSHELVRHRLFSFAQESTRYCNYTKDKFDNGLTFIYPSTFADWEPEDKTEYQTTMQMIEDTYKDLIKHLSPEQVRAVLPNSIKTELVVTGNILEWDHFLNLRYFGTTGKSHPDMKNLAKLIYILLTEFQSTL